MVGVCDTNCDPDQLDWPIPGNDDAARSIRLFCATMADAVIDGRAEAEAEKAAAHQQNQEASAAEAGEAPALDPALNQVEEVAAEEPVRTEE